MIQKILGRQFVRCAARDVVNSSDPLIAALNLMASVPRTWIKFKRSFKYKVGHRMIRVEGQIQIAAKRGMRQPSLVYAGPSRAGRKI